MAQLFDSDDCKKFRAWLSLDEFSITWDGQFREEFDQFWSDLYPGNLRIDQQLEAIYSTWSQHPEGPLGSWLGWLLENTVLYYFFCKKVPLEDMVAMGHMSQAELQLLLRKYLIKFSSNKRDLDLFFSYDHFKDEKISLERIQQHFPRAKFDNPLESQIMQKLEITIFDEWKKIFEDVTVEKEKRVQRFLSKRPWKKDAPTRKRYFLQTVLGVSIFVVIVLGIRVGNKIYEKYILDQIKILEPNFFWLSQNETLSEDRVQISESEKEKFSIEKLENISENLIENTIEVERIGTESEVILLEDDRDFKRFADIEQEESEYEEKDKGGLRDVAWGKRRAYRIILNSVDVEETHQKIAALISKHGAQQVDKVKPGQEIPGGLYYNLFVPEVDITNFVDSLSELTDSNVYISKIRKPLPEGMGRVFIWVKSI